MDVRLQAESGPAEMQRDHVKWIVVKPADGPSVANDALKNLLIPLEFEIGLNWRKDDPTIGTKTITEGEHCTGGSVKP